MGTLAPHSFAGVGTAGEAVRLGETVGKPDGPDMYWDEAGITVPTFLDPCEHMRLPKDSGMSWLMHHVPMMFRGYYRLEQLDEKYRAINGDELSRVRTSEDGFILCSSLTNQGTACRRRAVNYSGHCQAHGGKLHPLDKVVDARRTGMMKEQLGIGSAPAPGSATSEETLARMTRWQKLLSGVIAVGDLDDEELSRGQCRDSSGGFAGTPPRMVPKDLHDRMVRELFQRADETLKSGLLRAADSIVEIASGSAFEPADRIKAATWLWERLRGKVADVVVHTQDKPWEMVLTAVSGGSRAASRVERGVADEEEVLEAETVNDPGTFDPDPMASGDLTRPNAPTDKGFSAAIALNPDYDPDDPLDNPSAGLLDEPDPIFEPSQGIEYGIPAQDPERRQNEEWEKKQEAERKRQADVKLGQELAKVRESKRKARFAARAKGRVETFNGGTPAEWTIRDGKEAGEIQHVFTFPKAPKPKRGNDEFRHRI